MRRTGARSTFVLITAWFALVVGLLVPQPVGAHAFLLKSEPADGAIAPANLAEVRLTFSESVPPGPDRVIVTDSSGRRVDLRDTRQTRGDATVVTTSLGPLTTGVYTVRYSFLTADSHVVRGVFRFGVGVSAADVAAGPVRSTPGALSPPTILDALGRWINLLGLILLAGPALFGLLAFGARPLAGVVAAAIRKDYEGRQLRSTRLALGLLLIAQILGLAATAVNLSGAGLPDALSPGAFRTALSSLFGVWWLLRVATILVTVMAIDWFVAVRARTEASNDPRAGAAVPATSVAALSAGVVLILLTALNGHAATTSPVLLSLVIDVLHLAAAVTWLGGLVALALFLPGLERRHEPEEALSFLALAAPRLSTVAFWSVELLLATGLYQAWVYIAGPTLLTTSSYGVALVVKLALLLPMLVLAGVQRFLILPRLKASGSGGQSASASALARFRASRRLLLAEAGLAFALLLAVGFLTALPPARVPRAPVVAADSAPLSALGVTLADHAGPTLVTLTIGPTTSGPAVITARLQDAGGQALEAASVRFSASLAGTDTRVDTLLSARGGRFIGSADLTRPGTWRLSVAVTPESSPAGTASFTIVLPTGGARFLLAQADAAMNRLRSARERQSISAGGPPEVIEYQYQAPDRVLMRLRDGSETIGVSERRFTRATGGAWSAEPWPDPGGFRWPDYQYAQVATEVTLLGEEHREGVHCWVVAFATPANGARYTFWIGVDDSLVRAVRMIAPGHYMDATLSDFDAPVTITAPVP